MLCVSLYVMWRHRTIVNAARAAATGGSGGNGQGDLKDNHKTGVNATIVSRGRGTPNATVKGGSGAGDRKTIASGGDHKSASGKGADKLLPVKELV